MPGGRNVSRRFFLRSAGAAIAAGPIVVVAACSADSSGGAGDAVVPPSVADTAPGGSDPLFRALFAPLQPPTQITASVTTPGSLDVGWAEGSTSSGEPRYNIWLDGQLHSTVTDTTVTVTGLAPLDSHEVSISTLDEDGAESARTAALWRRVDTVDGDAPILPPVFTAVAASRGITFRWSHPGSGGGAPAASYAIFQVGRTDPIAVLAPTAKESSTPNSAFVRDIAPDQQQEYFLEARGEDGTPFGEALNRVRLACYSRDWPRDAAAPSVPVDLQVDPTEQGFRVSWSGSTDNAAGVRGYNVYADGRFVGQRIGDTTFTVESDPVSAPISITVAAFDEFGNQSAPSEATSVTPGSGTAAPTGAFTANGATIVDPQGQPFIPIGANVSGPSYIWNEEIIGRAARAADSWKWNTVRLCCGMDDWGAIAGGYIYFSNNDLARIVDEFTSRGIVVVITQFHKSSDASMNFGSSSGNYLSNSPGTAPDTSDRSIEQATVDWWVTVAKQFAGNARVWINPINEPGGSIAELDAQYRRMLPRIRAVAPRTPIVLDAAEFANDIPATSKIGTGTVRADESFVLSRGEGLDAAFGSGGGYGPLIFSIHVYSRWPHTYGGTSSITDAQLATRMSDYADQAASRGLPLLVGETGVEPDQYEYDSASVRVGLYGSGSDGGGSDGGVWEEKGVGVLVWHTSPSSGMPVASDGLAWSNVDQQSLAAQPPQAGAGLWAYAHRLNS